MSDSARENEPSTIAICALDGFEFAIPLCNLRAVVALNDNFSVLPRRQGGLDGILTYCNEPLPLIDLRLWLNWPSAATQHSKEQDKLALIIETDSRRVAIRVSALKNVSREVVTSTQLVHQQNNIEDVFNTAVKLPRHESKSIGVLDINRLFQLSEIWTESNTNTDHTANKTIECNESGRQEQLVIVCAADQHIGIIARDVIAVIPLPEVKPFGIQTLMQGYIQWRGRQVPVLSKRVFEVTGKAASFPFIAVVCHDDCWSAIPVTELKTLFFSDITQRQSLRSAGYAEYPFYSGIISSVPYGPILLLDSASLVTQCGIGINPAVLKQHKELQTSAINNKFAYIAIKAGGDWALPMEIVERVLPLPADIQRDAPEEHAATRQVTARMSYNNTSIAVWDTAGLLDGKIDTAESAVVILRWQGTLIGILIQKLLRILPPAFCETASMRGKDNIPTKLVFTKGNTETRKTYPLLELDEISRTLGLHQASKMIPANNMANNP